MAQALVVYFSRGGNTRKVAESIGAGLNAEVEPLLEPRSRRGLRGFMRSWMEALSERTSPLLPFEHAIGDYDLVVVGTPVWNHAVSTPVRTFLVEHRHELPRVAFFATEGSSGSERVFRQMAQLAGRKPEGELVLTSVEVQHGLHVLRAERFGAELAARLPAQPTLHSVGPQPSL